MYQAHLWNVHNDKGKIFDNIHTSEYFSIVSTTFYWGGGEETW